MQVAQLVERPRQGKVGVSKAPLQCPRIQHGPPLLHRDQNMNFIFDKCPQFKETPLTVEGLMRALQKPGVMTIAGYNGTCEKVVRFDALVSALLELKDKPGDYPVAPLPP